MHVSQQPMVAKRPSVWKLALNMAIPVVLIAVFAWQMHKNWAKISAYDWQLNWALVAAALLLLLLNSALEIAIWNRTLGWFAEPLPFRLAAPVYIWSSLARYVPGKVASLVLRVALTNEVKREVIPVLASSTVELALRTASGLFLLIIALLLVGGVGQNRSLLYISFALIPTVLVCAHPRLMMPAMNWALKKMKQQPLGHGLQYGDVIGIFVLTVVRWAIYGLAFALLAWAMYPAASAHIPVLIGTASGSWAAGFIGMSPGGLGIAEWVQNFILKTAVRFPTWLALMLPPLFRVATLIAEGAWALISLVFWRRR